MSDIRRKPASASTPSSSVASTGMSWKTSVTTADARGGAHLEAVGAGRRPDAGGLGGRLRSEGLGPRHGGPRRSLLGLVLGGLAVRRLRCAGGDDVGVLVLEDPLP